MEKFEFKSQICTTIEQSKRLIALGIKAETADCCHYYVAGTDDKDIPEDANFPAWSLHRLIEMSAVDNGRILINVDIPLEMNFYDELVKTIESLIKGGLFNPEYLEEEKNEKED